MLDLCRIIPDKLYKNILEVIHINSLQQKIKSLQQQIEFAYVQYIFSVRIALTTENSSVVLIIRNTKLWCTRCIKNVRQIQKTEEAISKNF